MIGIRLDIDLVKMETRIKWRSWKKEALYGKEYHKGHRMTKLVMFRICNGEKNRCTRH